MISLFCRELVNYNAVEKPIYSDMHLSPEDIYRSQPVDIFDIPAKNWIDDQQPVSGI